MNTEPSTHAKAWAARLAPSDRYVQAGRSVIAVAQICNILLITDEVAFTAPQQPAGPCASNWLSIWCVNSWLTGGTSIARVLSLLILVSVVIGFKPRWTCLPHFVVSLSLAMAFTVNTGGERVASTITALLVVVCLADDRTWAWGRTPLSRADRAGFAGAAAAAVLTIRGQLAVIYLVAAATKVVTPGWGTGGWLQSLLLDTTYGVPPSVLRTVVPIVENQSFLIFLEISVVAVEVAIAIGVCGTRRMRSVALVLGLLLHASIGVFMGLPAFALTMIGSLLVARGGSRRRMDGQGRSEVRVDFVSAGQSSSSPVVDGTQ